MRPTRQMAALATLLPLLACAQTTSVPTDIQAEVAHLRASVQPIDAPVLLAYAPHVAWQTHSSTHLETNVSAMKDGRGSKSNVVTDTEITATDAVSTEDGNLRDEGTFDTASVNGKSLDCDAEPLIRIDFTFTSQGALIADNSRPTCRKADAFFAALGSGIHSPLIQVQPTNWAFPPGGVTSGMIIRKLPGKTVNFDNGDLGARILGRMTWHDQPVVVAEVIGCGTAGPLAINDKISISPLRLCPNGIILFSTATAWPVGMYQWFGGTTDGHIGNAPINIDVTSELRQETR